MKNSIAHTAVKSTGHLDRLLRDKVEITVDPDSLEAALHGSNGALAANTLLGKKEDLFRWSSRNVRIAARSDSSMEERKFSIALGEYLALRFS